MPRLKCEDRFETVRFKQMRKCIERQIRCLVKKWNIVLK